MRTGRQRMLLTAVAVAGAVALYGCGGGDSGPDKTPFNQTDVDKAAADAKKKAEMEAAAAATAMAEAGTAAMEAKKAMEAATAAKKAAADAAKYAMSATLDMAKAMAASASASGESRKAAAAAKAARAAADKAGTAAAGQRAAKDAEASAKAAEKHAMEAEASATAAMRSYETAKSVKSDREATGVLSAAAGVHAEMARQQAKAAKDAADKVKDEVKKAKDAKTFDAADTAKKDADKARDAAQTASDKADAAAKAAEAIKSEAPAVTTKKTEARNHADAAMISLGKAQMYLHYTAGYADARKAYEEADAGKTDLASHKKYMDIVKWIKDSTTTNTKLDSAAKGARNAAEKLERSTNADVIKARQANLASALNMAMVERTKAGNDLKAAMDAYNAAKPFSENGMGTDGDNMASGKTLLHPSGKTSMDMDAARAFSPDQDNSHKGPYDFVWGYAIVSYGGVYMKPASGGGMTAHGKYQKYHFDRRERYGSAYEYVRYGMWVVAKDDFTVTPTKRTTDNNAELKESNTFAFADASNRSMDLPITGSATYTGTHTTHISVFAGNKGAGGNTAVISGPTTLGGGSWSRGNRDDLKFDGIVRATIDFAASKVNMEVDNWNSAYMVYDLEGIDLDRRTSTFTGGKYLGKRDPAGSRTSPASDPGRIHDPFEDVGSFSPVPTIKVHGGVFGPNADEITGTIQLSATVPHGESTHPNLAAAKDGTITVKTAFGAYNDALKGN